MRLAAIAAVIVVCNFATGSAAASTSIPPWLNSLLGSNDPTITPAVAPARSKPERGRIATCLASPAEVRKLQPKAWPRWTYGPQRERCWYAGKKPVFKKPTLATAARRPKLPTPASQQPATNAVRAWDHHNGDPIWQPWVMEHRWDESLRYINHAKSAP
jgi:hypothetical protein